MTASTWTTISPANITGFSPTGAGNAGLATGVAQAAATGETADPPQYSTENPLFWFGAIAVGTAVLLGVSFHVKVGPAKAAVSL